MRTVFIFTHFIYLFFKRFIIIDHSKVTKRQSQIFVVRTPQSLLSLWNIYKEKSQFFSNLIKQRFYFFMRTFMTYLILFPVTFNKLMLPIFIASLPVFRRPWMRSLFFFFLKRNWRLQIREIYREPQTAPKRFPSIQITNSCARTATTRETQWPGKRATSRFYRNRFRRDPPGACTNGHEEEWEDVWVVK